MITCKVQDFDQATVELIINAVDNCKLLKQPQLPVLVNSYGGSVMILNQILDILENSKLKIITILEGWAMSAGAVLWAAGHEKYMSKYSTLMIHNISSNFLGTLDKVKNEFQYIENINLKAFEILDNSAKKESGFFSNLLKTNNNEDLYIDSNEALELGFIQRIGVPNLLNQKNSLYEMNLSYKNLDIFSQNSLELKQDYKKPEGVKNMCLRDIESIQANNLDLVEMKSKLSEQTNTITMLQQELKATKESNELAFKIIKEKETNSYLKNLLSEGKILQADLEKHTKVLNSNVDDFIIDAYKSNLESNKSFLNKLSTGSKEEKEYKFESLENDYKNQKNQIELICKENNLNMSSSKDLQKAIRIYQEKIGV